MLLTGTKIATALTLCCLMTSAFGGKMSTTETKDNNTDLTESIKTDIEATEVVANKKDIKNKFATGNDNEENNDNVDDETLDDESEVEEKTAVQPAADTSFGIWDIVRGLWNWFLADMSDNNFADAASATHAVGEGRTFGKIRRMQMALIPIIFKFGVISAMIAFLVGLGIKTLFLVKVLVVMNLLALLAKFFTFKSNYEHFSAPPAPMWSPYVTTGWHSTPEDHHVSKEIHLHIHGGHTQPQVSSSSSYSYGSGIPAQSQGWEKRMDPYSAYDNIALQGQQNELIANELSYAANSIASKGQQYGRSFPANHRMF